MPPFFHLPGKDRENADRPWNKGLQGSIFGAGIDKVTFHIVEYG